jgi:glycosyltransferase involved in cell wall biosynthesis
LTGGWAARMCPRPDVIYANTWPLFATGILSAVSRLRRVPLVLSVQDVYPESLLAQGRTLARRGGLGARLTLRAMRALDGVIARNARAVIVISQHFARLYRSGRRVDPERIHVIPNWVDGAPFETGHGANGFRAGLGVPEDAFVVGYGGNLSVASGIETLVEAFCELPDAGDLHLLIAGAGSQLDACRELARGISQQRVLFYSPWPIEETAPLLRAADLLVLPTRGEQSLASVPSKLIAYMLAERPVLALALPGSDLSALVERSGCGWVVPPDRPGALARRIEQIAGMDAAARARRGRAGRAFARQYLTTEAVLPRLVELIEQVASG